MDVLNQNFESAIQIVNNLKKKAINCGLVDNLWFIQTSKIW